MTLDIGQETVGRLLFDYVAAWNAHDVDRLTSLFAEDGSYGDFGEGRVVLGQEEIHRCLTAMYCAVPDITITLTDYPVCSREHVLYKWVMKGTQEGEFAGVPPTGKPFEVRGSTVLLTRGDKIARAAHYFDVKSIIAQLCPEMIARSDIIALAPGFPVDEDNILYGE